MPNMQHSWPTLTWATLALVGCAPSKSDTGQSTSTEGELRVLTYNVHGLPSALTGDDTPGRMADIAPRLQPWDIVGLQEDFDAENHRVLVGSTDHETSDWFGEPLPDRAYGAGLSVMARLPMTEHRGVYFSTCNGVVDAASDCLASKGFQTIRMAVGSTTVDVYNTHLEAGGGAADQEARGIHIDELIDSMQDWSADRALIITGDFNLRPTDPSDLPLIERLRGEAGLSDACEAVGCSETNHIDQILYRSSNRLTLSATIWENASGNFIDADGSNLSDHPAISAGLQWDTL